MATNDILQLQQPLTAGAIRSVNFFNGRLLTSKDLTREQAARREAEWRLGLVLGEGVAFGLEVECDKLLSKPGLPVAHVTPGLAINRNGQALQVSGDVQLALTRRFEASPTADCLFANCTVLGGGTYVAGAGLYVLTLAPAATSEGKAPTNGLDPTNVRCNTDANIEAVQFRLIQVKPALYSDLDVGAASFRNAIAYRCFGAGVQPSWFANVLGAGPRRDDLIETLRQNVLSDVEAPLALLFFTGAADLQFIDLWSVRRPVAPLDAGSPFQSLVGPRRLAVGRAMFLQFQRHVADLLSSGSSQTILPGIRAVDYFRYLPAAALIPTSAGGLRGFDIQQFLSGVTYRPPVFIEGAKLDSIFDRSLAYAPIDLTSGELVWTYLVRHNIQAIDNATGAKPQQYVVLASGHMPFEGEARFDLNHWNYANFA